VGDPALPRRPLRVLVVDDDPDGAEACALWVGMLGHEVRIAGGCAEAVEVAASFAPDVVLLDGDGSALAVRLTGLLEVRPAFVAVTGQQGGDEPAQQGVFDHCLPKPFDPAVLAALLETCDAARRGP
jgi:CheY-like chemotaxis protein